MRLLSWIVIFAAMSPAYAESDRWQKHMQAGRKAFATLRFTEAEKHFGEAMREAARSGPESLRLADSLDGLADVYIAEAKLDVAEPLLQRSLAAKEKVWGPSSLDLAKSIDALADLYEREGKHAHAEPLYARSKSIREKAIAEHPDIYTVVDGKLVRRDPK